MNDTKHNEIYVATTQKFPQTSKLLILTQYQLLLDHSQHGKTISLQAMYT